MSNNGVEFGGGDPHPAGREPDNGQTPPHDSLTCLESWLEQRDIPSDRARLTTEFLRGFTTTEVRHSFDQPVRIGVTAGQVDSGRLHIWLSLLWPEPFSLGSLSKAKRANALIDSFAQQVTLKVRRPATHLMLYSPDEVPLERFPDELQRLCQRRNATYFGILTTPEVSTAAHVLSAY